MAQDQDLATQLARLGTAQPERDDARLRPEHAPLDDRDAAALLRSLRALAPLIRHYAESPAAASGDWSAYFPDGAPAGEAGELAALMARRDGRIAPHHALLIAFVRLLARPQARLNQFTARHLQHQMQRRLGFRRLAPQADRAHLVLELKKGSAAVEITPDHRFSAGKDASKVEQLFAPLRSAVVGAGSVVRLASIARQGQRLRFAPMANSADGLGAELTGDAPQWPPFGHATLPHAPVGFAIASPLLRLAEGERRVRLALRVSGWPAGLAAETFAAAFDAYVTGPEGWTGPLSVTASRSGALLTLDVGIGATALAVIDHDPALHLHAFPAALPVLQCLLRADAGLGFAALEGIEVQRARVSVRVRGLRGLVVESDDASIDPSKAFLPFGAAPVAGARWHIGCPEALAKPITSLSLKIAWQGAPADLYDWYAHFARRTQMLTGIGAKLSWRDAGGAAHTSGTVTLLPRQAAQTTLTIDGQGGAQAWSPAAQTQALQWSGSSIAKGKGLALTMAQPVMLTSLALAPLLASQFAAPAPAAAAARTGFISVTLMEDLLHGDYRRDAIAGATPPDPTKAFTPKVLNEPYTPKVQELSLDYEAQSDDSRLDDASQAAFTDTNVQFFQIDALGLAREQAWLTAARPWAPQRGVSLLPPHPSAGELLIGLAGVKAGDAVNLLLQVAEGSADPLAQSQTLQWSVLADNTWRTLGPNELVLDTTAALRASGLIGCVLPAETTTDHTRLPAGLVWLRATTPDQPRAACNLVGVHANAIEVAFVDQGNDVQRLATALPAGAIAKMKAPLAALKSVSQPYASFGGALAEDDAALARRAAERLRHRNRAISGWDVERLVLQSFPQVWRAKCVPHASEMSWRDPGHLTVIVVPDLRQRSTVDPLQPRVDLDTLTRIREHLSARCGPQVQVHVRNPAYRSVLLDFKVRLRPGFGINFHGPQIDQALRQALSPWAFDSDAQLGFGARVVRSQLLDFVESLPSVDFVTDFQLRLEGGSDDVDELVPDTPDAILVSAAAHRIAELIDG